MSLDSQQNIDECRFQSIIIFGDSFSDTGNVYNLTNGAWPIAPPYYHGRFSDDLIWTDRLTVSNVKNYAYAGATTDNAVVQGYTMLNQVPVPGIRQQIDIYIESVKEQTVDFEHTLYIVSAGGNDFVFSKVPNPFAVVAGLVKTINNLVKFGAKHILVFNQPPAEAFPYVHGLGFDFAFKQLTLLFNNLLLLRVERLCKRNPSVSLTVFNIHSIIKRILRNESSQFVNTVDHCWDITNDTSVVTCLSDPSKYVFCDKFHFTSTVHRIIADSVNDFMANNRNTFLYPQS